MFFIIDSMPAPGDSRNQRVKPAGSSQRSRMSLTETPTYSTTHFPEAPSLQNSTYAHPANSSDQSTFRLRKRQRRWSSEEEPSAVLPPAVPAQQVSGTAQQQLAAHLSLPRISACRASQLAAHLSLPRISASAKGRKCALSECSLPPPPRHT
jgi:hypothetical protein